MVKQGYIFPNDFTMECFGTLLASNVLDCSVCQFAHLYPLPDPAAVGRYYEGDYFYGSHSPSDWFAKERREYEGGLWDAYYSYLASLLDPDRPVIDYGCGSGLFLDYLWRHGWSQWMLYGIEPSKVAREASPIGHRLFKEAPNPLKFTTTIIDGYGYKTLKGNIILSLVLEHIPDPARFLQEDVLLHLDGRLVVVVPNEWNPLQRLAGLRRPKMRHWFVSQVHTNYFEPRTLRGLLERSGLKVVKQGATFPMELFLLMPNRDHRGRDDVGRQNHLWRLRLERRWPGVFRLYGWLGRRLGWGREIIMVATK